MIILMNMIDYKNLKKNMKQKRIDNIKTNHSIQRTCFYNEGNGHELCPHKTNCLLNEEVSTILNEIDTLKKESYNLNELSKRKNYYKIKKLEEKLRQTKTIAGGY